MDYTGKGWKFPPQFKTENKPEMVTESQEIKESLMILLGTKKGERVLQPEYGCNLQRLLFTNMEVEIVSEVKRELIRAIHDFEKRVSVEEILFHSSPESELIEVEIIYKTIHNSDVQNLIFPHYVTTT